MQIGLALLQSQMKAPSRRRRRRGGGGGGGGGEEEEEEARMQIGLVHLQSQMKAPSNPTPSILKKTLSILKRTLSIRFVMSRQNSVHVGLSVSTHTYVETPRVRVCGRICGGGGISEFVASL